jgi:hypothetical protein
VHFEQIFFQKEVYMKTLADYMREMPGYFKVQPPTPADILEAQEKLNLSFSSEYIEYLKEIGELDAEGIEFTGICYSEYQGKTIFSVVEDTIFERQIAKDCGYEFPADFYLIYNLDGILICQNARGEIFQIEMRPPEKIHDSLSDYFIKEIYNPVMNQPQEPEEED